MIAYRFRKLIAALAAGSLAVSGVQAASLTGGNASGPTTATTLVDIVFAIDTSGSMGGSATAISNAAAAAITNLNCPQPVWARARFLGIQGTWTGTVFDEVAGTVITGAGGPVPPPMIHNSSEDNAPVILDLIRTPALFPGPAVAGQRYFKGIVTIGDEGLENGSPVDQADYVAGKAANDLAIASSTLIFSIIANPGSVAGAVQAFTVLAEGGVLGGLTFANTGGFALQAGSSTNFQTELQRIICQTAGGGGGTPTGPVEVPTLSEWALILLSLMLAGSALYLRRRRG